MMEQVDEISIIMKPRLAIIIVNWNSYLETSICLDNLCRNKLNDTCIFILDNGSTDGSTDHIIKKLAKVKQSCGIGYTVIDSDSKDHDIVYTESNHIILVAGKENLGFAGGCNFLIDLARSSVLPDLYLFLNSDIRMDDDTIGRMISKRMMDTSVGMWAPMILFEGRDSDDIIFSQGGNLDMWRGLSPSIGIGKQITGPMDGHIDPDYLSGAFLMVDSDVLNRTGLFDTQFFAYWEETDLCVRARKMGIILRTYLDIQVRHKVSASTPGKLKCYYMYRNRILFMRKHASIIQQIFFVNYLVFFDHWKKIVGLIILKEFSKIHFVNRAFIDGMSSKGGIIDHDLVR